MTPLSNHQLFANLTAINNKYQKPLSTLAQQLHQHPELGMHETRACAWQVALLKQWGFKVTTPFASLSTAFRAVRGQGDPKFAILSEYDALPELGHACGHNLIAPTALGAGVMLADLMDRNKIPGTVLVIGTPAEESAGGKVIMTRNKAFDDLDAVIMAHPSDCTSGDNGSSAVRRFRVIFTGHATHAANSPELGINALDAVLLVFQGVNAWRQQLPESSRVHGIVVEGGVAPNIIPEQAVCDFFLRSPQNHYLSKMITRFKAIARGAGLMTGTKMQIQEIAEGYLARKVNRPLDNAYLESATHYGLKPILNIAPGRASSDFGDVSLLVPGTHVYFGICRKPTPVHSTAFAEAAGTPYAIKQMLRAAQALASVGYRFFTDPAFREDVQDKDN